MAYTYSAYVIAQCTLNSDNLAIEIDSAANTTLKITTIRVTQGDGTAIASTDAYKEIRFVIESAAGTGGSSFTPTDMDFNAPASTSTVKTGLTAVGTVSTTVDTPCPHSTTDFYWEAADEDDKIVITPGGIFGIIVNPAG